MEVWDGGAGGGVVWSYGVEVWDGGVGGGVVWSYGVEVWDGGVGGGVVWWCGWRCGVELWGAVHMIRFRVCPDTMSDHYLS